MFHDIFQQLLDSDLKTELASAAFLKQYKNYSIAAEQKGVPVSAFLPSILFYLTTVEKLHFQKLKLYQILSRNAVHKHISSQQIHDLERIESEIQSMKNVVPVGSRLRNSAEQLYLEDLYQLLSNKKRLFMTLLTPPSKPWISPLLKKQKGQAN